MKRWIHASESTDKERYGVPEYYRNIPVRLKGVNSNRDGDFYLDTLDARKALVQAYDLLVSYTEGKVNSPEFIFSGFGHEIKLSFKYEGVDCLIDFEHSRYRGGNGYIARLYYGRNFKNIYSDDPEEIADEWMTLLQNS